MFEIWKHSELKQLQEGRIPHLKKKKFNSTAYMVSNHGCNVVPSVPTCCAGYRKKNTGLKNCCRPGIPQGGHASWPLLQRKEAVALHGWYTPKYLLGHCHHCSPGAAAIQYLCCVLAIRADSPLKGHMWGLFLKPRSWDCHLLVAWLWALFTVYQFWCLYKWDGYVRGLNSTMHGNMWFKYFPCSRILTPGKAYSNRTHREHSEHIWYGCILIAHVHSLEQ